MDILEVHIDIQKEYIYIIYIILYCITLHYIILYHIIYIYTYIYILY